MVQRSALTQRQTHARQALSTLLQPTSRRPLHTRRSRTAQESPISWGDRSAASTQALRRRRAASDVDGRNVVVFLVVHHQTWRLSKTHNFAGRHHARMHRAVADMSLVTCKWRCCRSWALHGLSGVPIGALLVVLHQWLLIASVRRMFLVG